MSLTETMKAIGILLAVLGPFIGGLLTLWYTKGIKAWQIRRATLMQEAAADDDRADKGYLFQITRLTQECVDLRNDHKRCEQDHRESVKLSEGLRVQGLYQQKEIDRLTAEVKSLTERVFKDGSEPKAAQARLTA